MVENATMIQEGVFLEERKVRFLVRQCTVTSSYLNGIGASPLDPGFGA